MRQACWEYVACTHANLIETGQQFYTYTVRSHMHISAGKFEHI